MDRLISENSFFILSNEHGLGNFVAQLGNNFKRDIVNFFVGISDFYGGGPVSFEVVSGN